MYKTPNGKEVFVLDTHTHFWDARPENQANIHGKQFIDCFYSFHVGMSPPEERWTHEKFMKFSEDDIYSDLFVDGHNDMAIIQSTYLKDFYKTGFSEIGRSHAMAARHPERFIINGTFDPRDGEKALDYIHFMKETYNITGAKLYNAEWNGESKGWSLKDPAAYKCFELCEKLGIRNMHVHKGPTILPLSKDAFDVHDVDYAATDFQNLNWVVEHAGLPRLEHRGFGGELASIENLGPAIGKPAVAHDQRMGPTAELPRHRLHRIRAATGHQSHRLGVINLAQHG